MTDHDPASSSSVGDESPETSRPSRQKKDPAPTGRTFTPEERLLVLDVWLRSEVSAGRFGELVGISAHSLYQWQRRFEQYGPAGLEDRPRGQGKGSSRLPEPTQRAILMLKRSHPDWGTDRLHDVLLRSQGYAASPGAIQRVLIEQGYEVVSEPTRPHAPQQAQRFERAQPNQLWQTDLFTFLLKRENRRLYLVVFMDDHSRYVVSYSLAASSSGSLAREALEHGIANYGPPEEVLTDNGPQYHSWRGKSAFRKLLDKRGIRQIVARPKRPQTLGKTERFWQTLWKECLESAIPVSVEDARQRVGHFIDYYNFQRTHQGIGGLVPADRFFDAEAEVRKTIEARVKQNALDLARHGMPRQSVYLTGQVGGEGISLHGEGGRVVLTTSEGRQQEVDLTATGKREQPKEESDGHVHEAP